jgi:hypothetical protein
MRQALDGRGSDPHWIVLHHPYTRPDGVRVPARTKALYWPGAGLLFGQEAEQAESNFPRVATVADKVAGLKWEGS